MFLAELLSRNFKAKLGKFSSNPDIEANVNSHTYAIECKRIFNEKSFVFNYKKTTDQLKETLNNGEYNFGIPVIDVSRVFIVKEKENLILKSDTEYDANKKALDVLEEFFNKYKTQLYENYNPKIPSIILRLSTPVVLKNQKPFSAWGRYLIICELSKPSQISLFHIIKSDFSKLSSSFNF